MIRKVQSLALTVILVCIAGAGASSASAEQPSIDVASYASTYELAQLTASIKSATDLLRAQQMQGSNALGHLSPPAQKRFVSSITFGEHGVSGFSYEDLERELTPTQAFEVLTMIGQQQFVSQMQGLRIETELDAMLMKGDVPGAQAKCHSPWLPPVGSVGGECGPLEGYRCTGPGNCQEAMRNACTQNC